MCVCVCVCVCVRVCVCVCVCLSRVLVTQVKGLIRWVDVCASYWSIGNTDERVNNVGGCMYVLLEH